MTGIAIAAAVLLGAVAGWEAILGAGLALIVVLAMFRDRRLVPLALVILAAGAVGAWRGDPPRSIPPMPWVDAATAVRGTVDEAPVVGGRFQRAVLTVTAVRGDSDWNDAAGTVCLIGPLYPAVGVGDGIVTYGEAVPVDDLPARLRGYLRSQGCGASMAARWLEIERRGDGWNRSVQALSRRISGVLQEGATGDAGALLSGLVTGDDHALSTGRQGAFLETGTTHLTAVSGANVALLVTIAASLGSAAGWRRRLGWQALTVVAVWGYAVLTGAEPPAVRAALVATGVLLATRFGRKADCATLVMLAAAAMVVVDPSQVWRLSFRLSVVSSLALAVVLSGIAPSGFLGWLRGMLIATVAAQIATLPMLLPLDGKASLVALPANLLVAPLVNVAFPVAALAAVGGILSAPLGEVLLLPALLAAEGVLSIVDAAAASSDAIAVGVLSPTAVLLLTATAAGGVLAISAEGRVWARRLARSSRRPWPGKRSVAFGTAAGGLALILGRWLLL